MFNIITTIVLVYHINLTANYDLKLLKVQILERALQLHILLNQTTAFRILNVAFKPVGKCYNFKSHYQIKTRYIDENWLNKSYQHKPYFTFFKPKHRLQTKVT